MYVGMGYIHDGHVLSLIDIIMAPGVSLLGIFRVYWMKEWFNPYDLVLASLNMINTRVFFSFRTSNIFGVFNFVNFSLAKMTYHSNNALCYKLLP